MLKLLARLPGVAFLLLVLLVVFGIFASGFASLANVLNIGVQSSILLLLALPMTFIIMTEGLDLSMGAVLGLTGVVLASVLVAGNGLGAAFAAALAVGMTFGLMNGFFVVALGLPPFVTTLGTLGIAQGIALALTNGESVVGIGPALPRLYASTWAGIPFSILVAVLVYAVFHFLLYYTRFGNYVFAIGGNREALVLAGVPASVFHISVYVLAGLMAGVAALLLTGRMNSGHPIAAMGMEFDAIAAVIAGGTERQRGNGWLPGTVLGVLTVGVLRNGLNVLALPSSLQVASIGVLLITALLIDSLRRRRS
jgi:ribose transport system permease protein